MVRLPYVSATPVASVRHDCGAGVATFRLNQPGAAKPQPPAALAAGARQGGNLYRAATGAPGQRARGPGPRGALRRQARRGGRCSRSAGSARNATRRGAAPPGGQLPSGARPLALCVLPTLPPYGAPPASGPPSTGHPIAYLCVTTTTHRRRSAPRPPWQPYIYAADVHNRRVSKHHPVPAEPSQSASRSRPATRRAVYARYSRPGGPGRRAAGRVVPKHHRQRSGALGLHSYSPPPAPSTPAGVALMPRSDEGAGVVVGAPGGHLHSRPAAQQSLRHRGPCASGQQRRP